MKEILCFREIHDLHTNYERVNKDEPKAFPLEESLLDRSLIIYVTHA